MSHIVPIPVNSLPGQLVQQSQQMIPILQPPKFQINNYIIPQGVTMIQIPNIQIIQKQIPNIQINNIQQRKPHPKSKFTIEEDNLLKELVSKYGENDWNRISELMPHRNVRQCKERWVNYLSPKVCNDPWTEEEDALLLQKYKELGAKWVRIALSFPNRTDSNVKNRYLVLSRRSKRIENMIHLNASNENTKTSVSDPPIIRNVKS